MNRPSRAIRWLSASALLLATVLWSVLPAIAAPQAALDIKFSGVITAVPAAAGEPWEIAGQMLAVNAVTRVRLTCGPAAAGMWADVTAQRQADDSLLALHIAVRPPEVRIKGPVAFKPEDGIGAWVIAGQTLWVTAETAISQRGGPVDVGYWVEVYAVEEPAGTLTASRLRGIELQEDVEVFGALQAFSETSWRLSSIPVAVTPETLIAGEAQVGLLAHAAALLQADGTLLGLVVKALWQEPNSGRPQVQFTGTVQSLPTGGLNGHWQVDGRDVEVTPSTTIGQAKGLVEIGAQVHVTGWQTAEGAVVGRATGAQTAERTVAAQITVLASSSGGGANFHLSGVVEARPGNGDMGTWTIAGQQVEVTRQTRLHGAEQIRLGEPVEAGGLQQQDGVRIATWLRTRTQGGPGPQPSVTPQPSHTPSVTPNPSHTPSITPGPSGTPGGPNPTRTPGPGKL